MKLISSCLRAIIKKHVLKLPRNIYSTFVVPAVFQGDIAQWLVVRVAGKPLSTT